MAGNYLCALGFAAEQLYHLARNIAVRCPVCAVAADVIFFIHLVGKSVHIRLGRHGLVEGGVEYEHLRYAGHDRKAAAYALKVCARMQGGKVVAQLEL